MNFEQWKVSEREVQANDFAPMLPSGCSPVVAVSELTRGEVEENSTDSTTVVDIIK